MRFLRFFGCILGFRGSFLKKCYCLLTYYSIYAIFSTWSSCFSQILKHRPDLYLRVRSFLLTLKRVLDITPYLQNNQIYRFPKEYDGLYEMRIPKQARGGVFRIYFCMSLRELRTLILLCAELKHKKEPMKLTTAFSKLKQYRELVRQGAML